MATDKKISQLSSGAPAQAGDEYVVARSGANYKLTLTNIAANMPATTVASGDLIVSSGNVGIGTASPGTKLDAYNSSTTSTVIRARNDTTSVYLDANNGYSYLNTFSNHPMLFGTNNIERMRIDSSGNVGIGGTADAYDKVAVKGTLPVSGNVSIAFANRGTIPSGTTNTAISFASLPTTAAASFTISQLDHFRATQGTFGAGSAATAQYGFHATDTLTGATNNYGFYSNIASGSNRWNFYAGGTAANYFAGKVLVGTTTPVGSSAVMMYLSAGGETWQLGPEANGNFAVTNDADVGVYVQNGQTAWSSTSDERIKTDLVPIANALNKVSSLRTVTGRYIKDAVGTSRSFLIAQDVQAVFPEAVDVPKKESDPLGLRYTDVIPLLVAAIKELSAKVAALEAK